MSRCDSRSADLSRPAMTNRTAPRRSRLVSQSANLSGRTTRIGSHDIVNQERDNGDKKLRDPSKFYNSEQTIHEEVK